MSLSSDDRIRRRELARRHRRVRRWATAAGVLVLVGAGVGLGLAIGTSGSEQPVSQPAVETVADSLPNSTAVVSGSQANESRTRPKTSGSIATTRSTGTSVPKPSIVRKPIPYPAKRRSEMAAYALRHYGIDTWRLVNPRVIVEHYTATDTFSSPYSTFASDTPDGELGELPGTCAHFIVDRDGTIYQLVPTTIMCRHTVGLNYTAIGIEHVGRSDRDILDNPRQLLASLALTLWLMQRNGIKVRNVIGHNESLTSPLHREHYAPWRCQTHGDWTRADMNLYRAKLAKLASRYGIKLGPTTNRSRPKC